MAYQFVVGFEISKSHLHSFQLDSVLFTEPNLNLMVKLQQDILFVETWEKVLTNVGQKINSSKVTNDFL